MKCGLDDWMLVGHCGKLTYRDINSPRKSPKVRFRIIGQSSHELYNAIKLPMSHLPAFSGLLSPLGPNI